MFRLLPNMAIPVIIDKLQAILLKFIARLFIFEGKYVDCLIVKDNGTSILV